MLGVSGGADSVALLRFFCEIREEWNLTLSCIHVEHGLRGEESLGDAAFVEQLCQQLDVPCQVVSVGAEIEAMDDTHMSLEEKARRVRYEVLEQAAVGERIALAHHRDDNVETMLFHLARGTGLDGLRGMPMQRDNIIRPFLGVGRDDIEAYLKALSQGYRVDATNIDQRYDRNKIRHKIIPSLGEVNDRAIMHMNQAAVLVGEVADYINAQAQEILAETVNGQSLAVQPLRDLPDFMIREVLHLFLQKFIPGAKDISASHLQSMQELLDMQVGKEVHLPKGWRVRRSYEGIQLVQPREEEPEVVSCEVVIAKEELEEKSLSVTYGKCELILEVKDYVSEGRIPRNNYTKWFDYDKIKKNIHIRGRRVGDYFICDNRGSTKGLKDYFINEKIPSAIRDEIPLICDDSHVMWIVGYRISEYYKVNDTTKKILEVHMIEENKNE